MTYRKSKSIQGFVAWLYTVLIIGVLSFVSQPSHSTVDIPTPLYENGQQIIKANEPITSKIQYPNPLLITIDANTHKYSLTYDFNSKHQKIIKGTETLNFNIPDI